ncbi:hypothetical protein [Streptomyces sp. MK7]|uniref:hypothetical protein n=1 Tax=Streptomyces sp. MK7 TaxID=3067635 RepID=UPI00292F4D47|nr:hypothetical protein [Streptomyces sp. MK7]
MTTATLPRIPADVSDELLRKLHLEAVWNVPLAERRTCPEHLNWRAVCAPKHALEA